MRFGAQWSDMFGLLTNIHNQPTARSPALQCDYISPILTSYHPDHLHRDVMVIWTAEPLQCPVRSAINPRSRVTLKEFTWAWFWSWGWLFLLPHFPLLAVITFALLSRCVDVDLNLLATFHAFGIL